MNKSIDLAHDRQLGFILLLPLVFLVVGMLIRLAAVRYQVPNSPVWEYFDVLCRWDCDWYVKMAERGYDRFPTPNRVNAGNWAFFPFYPMLVGAVAKLIALPTIVIGSLASFITAYACVVLAWPLLGRDRRAYTLYAIFILSGPVSVYFTTLFTEVMFVLLTTLVFRFLGQRNYLAASGVAALLSATRIVGVFIAISIGVQALVDYRRDQGSWRGVVPGILRQPKLLLAFVVAPLGLFVYMAFLHNWVGDGLAFSHTQRAWGRQFGSPLEYVWRGLTSGPGEGLRLSPPQILALSACAGLVMTGVLAWRRQWAAATFALLAIIVPLSAGLASMLRFMAGMAPLTIALMTILGKNRWIFALSACGLLAGAWFTTLAWLGGSIALV